MHAFVACITMILGAVFLQRAHATHFYGVQLAASLVENVTAGVVTVNFYWREIWNANPNSGLSTISSVSTCSTTGTPCPSGPATINMGRTTSNCQQTVSASGISYDSRTGLDTQTWWPESAIPTTQPTYYTMGFNDSAWGLIPTTPNLAFGAEIDILISRRTDNNAFDNTPRSSIAPIVTIRPACGGTGFQIPYYDPDGDPVQCRWANTSSECRDVGWQVLHKVTKYFYYSLVLYLS